MDKTYINQKEAAAMLEVSPSTIRNMVKDGRLKPRKIYKRALYDSGAVRRLLEDETTSPPAAIDGRPVVVPVPMPVNPPRADLQGGRPEPKRGIFSWFTGA